MRNNGTLHKRIEALEQAAELEQTDEDGAAWVYMATQCAKTIAAIDAGWITHSEYGDSGKVYPHKPAPAVGLPGEAAEAMYRLLWYMNDGETTAVAWWAGLTGWESPLARFAHDKRQAHTHDELGTIARQLLGFLEDAGIVAEDVPTYTPHEEPGDVRLYGRWEWYQRGIRQQFRLGEYANP